MEPKPWGLMTPEEKGALLLAQYEGKVIERQDRFGNTWSAGNWNFKDASVYRVRPEPRRETVRMLVREEVFGEVQRGKAQYVITYDTIDGEADCASIKMEKLL